MTNRLINFWKRNALHSWRKYLDNRLSEEGIFNCPRGFILRYLNKDKFEYLIQSQNKTYYKFK